MRRWKFTAVLAAEAVFCVLLYGVGAQNPAWFSTALAFPFQQIGRGLQALSLSGGAGNVIAIPLYVAVSLIPMGVLFLLKRRRELVGEDALLVFLSLLLFATLYYAVNPGLLPAPYGLETSAYLYQSLFGGAVYALVFCYLAFRALRLFTGKGRERLQDYLAILLRVLAIGFVFVAFGSCFHGLLGDISALQAGNVGNEDTLGVSYVFLALRWLVTALSYVLDLVVTLAALDLLAAMKENRYSEVTVEAGHKVSHLCVVSLKITLLATVLLNLLQLMALKLLLTVEIQVVVPVLSVAFVLAVLLLTRFVAENRQLKADNDLFI